MSSKYYEESEYYVKEYEVRNGLGRESIEQEQRTRGTPFESSLRYERPPFNRDSRLRDDFPELQRFRDDLDSRARSSHPTSGYASMDRRQQSLPPLLRSSYYDYPTYSSSRIPPGPTTTYPYSSTDPYRTYTSEPYRSTAIHEPIRRPSTDAANYHSYHPSATTPLDPQSKHSRGPSLLTTSRPGSPQPVAGVGDIQIQNTEEGFTIHLDVKHFEPKDIKVSLAGSTLTVTGDRIEDDPAAEQTLKRSFSRKYAIPDDIRLETIKSFMTDNGFLLIRGNRKAWKETEISVHFDSSYAPASNV